MGESAITILRMPQQRVLLLAIGLLCCLCTVVNCYPGPHQHEYNEVGNRTRLW